MNLRSTPILIATTLTLAVGGGAGAATMHRFDIAETSGSAGALTILQSTSSGGAIQGQVGATADTKQTIPFGMYGAYSGIQFGMGVVGISQTGYGVAAETFGSDQPAMIALSKSGGDALDTVTGDADASLSTGGVSVYGSIVNGIAGYFYSTATPAGNPAVYAYGYTGGSFTGVHGDGLDASSDDGQGLTASTSGCFGGCHGGTGVVGGGGGQGLIAMGKSGSTTAAVEAVDTVGGSDLLAAYAYNGGSESESFIVQSNTANASGHTTGTGKASDVQISGDVYVSGAVYQSCGTFPETKSTDCGSSAATSVRTSSGDNVRMYGVKGSAPAIEDVGIAHLSNGRVHVSIDRAFARTMSREDPYHVFLTPDGPSRGVYTLNRSTTGFDIAENPGGTSTVDVEYRVVATPFADRASRLAELGPVRKTSLAAEVANARIVATVKATQAASRLLKQQMQTTNAQRRAELAQRESTLARPR
jgi:hypothetical protein